MAATRGTSRLHVDTVRARTATGAPAERRRRRRTLARYTLEFRHVPGSTTSTRADTGWVRTAGSSSTGAEPSVNDCLSCSTTPLFTCQAWPPAAGQNNGSRGAGVDVGRRQGGQHGGDPGGTLQVEATAHVTKAQNVVGERNHVEPVVGHARQADLQRPVLLHPGVPRASAALPRDACRQVLKQAGAGVERRIHRLERQAQGVFVELYPGIHADAEHTAEGLSRDSGPNLVHDRVQGREARARHEALSVGGDHDRRQRGRGMVDMQPQHGGTRA